MSFILQGGPVFWLIAVLGLAAVVVFFERLLHLRRAQIDFSDFLKGVCNVLENGNVEEAIVICEETPGPVAAVALAAIRHRHCVPDELHNVVACTGHSEMGRMERRLASLAITCQVAPLLGLAGTLLGVIKIVQTLNEQAPVVQSTDLTAGLMQALLATVAGLVVAAPCHAMYVMLMGRIERIALDMEAAGAEMVAYFTRTDKPKQL